MVLLALTILLGIAGCTSIKVRPVDLSVKASHICIKENPRVWVSDFVPVLRDGFDRHGISTEVFSGPPPDRCEYVLSYIALQSWDFAPYLSHAELRIEKGGRQVAYAEYHLRGEGGLSLMKWQGTRAKMDPLIDELLKSNGS